jgi:outer membrane protein OmpA-like peptidoglycan-associated protein
MLNAVDNISYKISGYADMQTGSKAHNLELSQERAEAVYNFLVKEQGVDPKKLVIEAVGGVDIMYYGDRRLSRAVTLTIQK